MSLKALGEFGLIARIKKSLKTTDASVIKGIGDDCAVLDFDALHYQLFTCDMLIQGVDFTSRADPYLIGRKALAVSLSDIAACGGLPRYALVALGIPRNYPVSSVDKILKGMRDLAVRFKVTIVGGDMSRASVVTLDVSMLGIVEKKFLVLRDSARPGDVIFVTGSLGGSIQGKHFSFTPRIKESRFLVKHVKLHAMMDISDGLAQDLGHILEESRVGAVLHEESIPLGPLARGFKDALWGGEDFELLFTLSKQQADKLISLRKHAFIPVGEITAETGVLRLRNRVGQLKILKQKGFRHF